MVWIPGEKERYVRELLSHRGRLVRSRTAVINEWRAVYAKRNMEVVGEAWLRAHPVPYRVKELSGDGPRIVEENVELLRFVNELIEGLDERAKTG